MAFYSGFTCDKCGESWEMYGYTATEILSITHLRQSARSKGFSVGKQVLCETCKRGGKHEKDHKQR